MTIRDLIERLNEFNPEDEVRVGDWFKIDYADVGVSNTPNVVSIGYGLPGIKDIVDELSDAAYDLGNALDDLEDEGVDINDAECALDSINLNIDELRDLEY